MKSKEINVLYVDDEINNLEGFKAQFRRNYNVFTAISAEKARLILESNDIHILITDQKMPVTVGTELLEQAVKNYPQQIRILLSAFAETTDVINAFQTGLIYKYVLKPYSPEALMEIIDDAYKVYRLRSIKDLLYKEWLKTQEALEFLRTHGRDFKS
jgi:response regulator RpfG family c-di-GMP phosphodiesterase